MSHVKNLDLQYVTNERAQKRAVIIPIDQFEQLMEDVEDLAAVAERRDVTTVAHADLISELKRDGLL